MTPTLAQRIFDAARYEDECFSTINRILGCEPDNCLAEGFVWAAYDTFWDDYDDSVEIVLTATWPEITDEQALKILDLGFHQIYQSHNGTMTNISRCYSAPGKLIEGKVCRWVSSSTRDGNDDNQWRAKAHAFQRENAQLREALANPSPELVSALLCSQAKDDEGKFPILLDLLGFSGENKARTVAVAAIRALNEALIQTN